MITYFCSVCGKRVADGHRYPGTRSVRPCIPLPKQRKTVYKNLARALRNNA